MIARRSLAPRGESGEENRGKNDRAFSNDSTLRKEVLSPVASPRVRKKRSGGRCFFLDALPVSRALKSAISAALLKISPGLSLSLSLLVRKNPPSFSTSPLPLFAVPRERERVRVCTCRIKSAVCSRDSVPVAGPARSHPNFTIDRKKKRLAQREKEREKRSLENTSERKDLTGSRA